MKTKEESYLETEFNPHLEKALTTLGLRHVLELIASWASSEASNLEDSEHPATKNLSRILQEDSELINSLLDNHLQN